MWYFNSQPHKEADGVYRKISTPGNYFNSQPHKEADDLFGCCLNGNCISTHSLTRRLTGWSLQLITLRSISTHSLTRRLTPLVGGHPGGQTFQLTASQGGWHCEVKKKQHGIMYFNSQPHKEADMAENGNSGGYGYFNSQPHKEADKSKARKKSWKPYFNSQPHKEADGENEWEKFFSRHFNSQPHKEADSSKNSWPVGSYISTHSLTRRLTYLAVNFYH